MINITFPDGAVREFESGVTTFEIAQSISNSLAKKALAGKFNGKLIDTTRVITEDGSIEIVTPDHEDALPILRHSAAHLFAQAARRLFPDIHFGVGPAIEDGFYYDTDNQAGQISNEDLPRIEEEMKKIVSLLCNQFTKRLESQMNIHLKLRESAKALIVEKGTDAKYGARPLRRALQTELEDKLADAILNGEIQEGDHVAAGASKKGIHFVKTES